MLKLRVVIVALVVAGSAFAQTEKKKAEPKKLAPVQTLVFGDGSEIDGSVVRPDVDVIVEPPKLTFKSMIKIRENFDDKLLQSVNEL